jgi:hypothetical protein
MPVRYNHSTALRVIGQLLQERGLDLFDLNYDDDEVFLQCGGPIPPYLDLVELNYSLSELRELDDLAKRNRAASSKWVNFEGLPEILRAIGRRIDDRQGRLLRVSNGAFPSLQESITVEYQTRDKSRQIEELFLPDVGDDAMRMYKRRSRRFVS